MNRNELIDRIKAGQSFKYILFWGHTPNKDGSPSSAVFSQWFDCRFSENGQEYHTAEQYMMCKKAELFGDDEIRQKIMAASEPAEYKKLGRMIRGFDEEVWLRHRFEIVVTGNMLKFSQNPDLKNYLLNTGRRILAEASPYDRIWGIGLAADDPKAQDPLCWQGENLLGFALMEVREGLYNQRI